MSIVGLGALVYAIIEAPAHGWTSTTTLGWFAGAAIVLASFVAWELNSTHPMLDVRFFANPRFTAASLSVMLVFFALFGAMFFLTQYLQFVLGYSAFQAGLRMIPVALAVMVGAPVSAKLAERIGTKTVVAAGLTTVAAGMALAATATVASGYGLIGTSMVVIGVGMGLTMAPATESIMGSLPREKAGVGSAMNDTTREVGGAMGVAVLGSLLTSSYGPAIEPTVESLGLREPAASAVSDGIAGAATVADQLGGDAGQTLLGAAQSAFVDAMQTAFVVGAGVALTGALVALAFLPARAPKAATEPDFDLDESALALESAA
jgi:MFS family permease